MYPKYHRLFRGEEAYKDARDMFEDAFLEDHDLIDHMDRESIEFLLRDVLDDPLKAQRKLKDDLYFIKQDAWRKHLDGLLEDMQQAA